MRSFMTLAGFAAVLLASAPASAFDIPKGLSASDRMEIVRTLGLNTATKMLDNPYPLGGYSGFEVGWSLEVIDVSDLRRLGCAPGSSGCPNTSLPSDSDWKYSRLTFGKGLYNDVDVFFNFIPPAGGMRVSDYGGALRWSFYEAKFLPINISAIGYFDQLNYQNDFTNQNLGLEMMVGVNVDNFALYFGGGEVQATGTFIGPDSGGVCNENCTFSDTPDTSSRTVSHRVLSTHTVVGFSLHYDNLFAAAEVDRYQDAVYSMKVGTRF